MDKRSKFAIILILGLATLFLVSIASLSIGSSERAGFKEVVGFLLGKDLDSVSWKIIRFFRIPRTLCGISVGIGLSIAGLMLQSLLRNPLVDPYILGCSSGAMFGLILAMYMHLTAYILVLPATFLGAMLATVITLTLARIAGGSETTIVLAGIVVTLFFSALSVFMQFLIPRKSFDIFFLLFGDLSSPNTKNLILISLPGAVATIYGFARAQALNLVLLGEIKARDLGLNFELIKWEIVSVASLITALSVAIAGVIGFIGLMVPHIARILAGSDHRLSVPSTIFAGACLLLGADIISRVVMRPTSIPVGVVTSLMGAPFFAALLMSKRRSFQP